MLRRLGEGLNRINTNGSTNSSSTVSSSPSPLTPTNNEGGTGASSGNVVADATSAAKRAWQLAYNRSNSSSTKLSAKSSDEAAAALASSTGLSVMAPTVAVSPSLNPPTPPRKDYNGVHSDDNDWDSIQLPFGSSQNSHGQPVANGIATTTSRSGEAQAATVPSGMVLSTAYAMNASSLVDLKDEMMMELLSSDALLHVGAFEILGFDEVEELRKVCAAYYLTIQRVSQPLLSRT